MLNGIIKGYKLNWMGTRYDYKLEKALNRKHRYLFIVLLVRDVQQVEALNLAQKMNSLPFLYAEASGSNYFAELPFAVDSITEALHYIAEAIEPVKERATFYIIDQTDSLAFTIAPKLFSQEERQWKFDTNELLARFENLLVKIREGAS